MLGSGKGRECSDGPMRDVDPGFNGRMGGLDAGVTVGLDNGFRKVPEKED